MRGESRSGCLLSSVQSDQETDDRKAQEQKDRNQLANNILRVDEKRRLGETFIKELEERYAKKDRKSVSSRKIRSGVFRVTGADGL